MNMRTSIVRACRDGLILQLLCYSAGIAVMILGLRKLPEFATSERDVFFGVLLVMTLGVLMILVGMILQLLLWQQKARDARSDDLA